MSIYFKQFMMKFKDYNFRVLWAEAVVLSVIIGSGLGSWPGVIILLAALMWVLNRRWGTVYLIVIFSCAWGFLAGIIGYGIFGWAWALLLGGLALISGVKLHCRDLKRPFEKVVTGFNKTVESRQGLYWGRQNLN